MLRKRSIMLVQRCSITLMQHRVGASCGIVGLAQRCRRMVGALRHRALWKCVGAASHWLKFASAYGNNRSSANRPDLLICRCFPATFWQVYDCQLPLSQTIIMSPSNCTSSTNINHPSCAPSNSGPVCDSNPPKGLLKKAGWGVPILLLATAVEPATPRSKTCWAFC